jgi:malate/lactate dehydrogenase
MAQGGRHPDKNIRKAIKDAQNEGWKVDKAKGAGHRWGTASCGYGCAIAISSTPRCPDDIAKRIQEAVKKCDHDLRTPTSAERRKDDK